jgi:SNF2 family DNA or RNA helicase
MQTLLDSQVKAIDKLSLLKVGALFKRPGTGKSRTAIELINSAPVSHVIWLAPFRSINPSIPGTGIIDEVEKWGLNKPVKFIGIESLSSSDRLYIDLYNHIDTTTFLVCDESLKIKNSDAKRTQRIIELGKKCNYKLILNGTPMSRNLLDIWAQMEFLSPKILNMCEAEFKNTFCEYTRITKRLGHKQYTREFITKYHNIDYLYSKIEPFIFEASLQLDVKQQHINVSYAIEPKIKNEYAQLKEKYLDNEKLQLMNNNIFLEMTQKMQHLYCLSAEKFEVTRKIIKEHGADNVVIFCKFISSREECKRAFPDVTILSIQADSMSINLQSKSVTIEWDKTWDFALVDQYHHRTYRTGQEHTCYYYYLDGDVKLDGLIKANNAKKQGELQYFKTISRDQLKEEL